MLETSCKHAILTIFILLRCRFLYFFSLCDIRNEAVFLLLAHSSLRGVNRKNMLKRWNFGLFDCSKTAKQFSVNSHGKFLCQYQAGRRAGKQVLSLKPFFLRILDTFHILSCYFSEIYFPFCFGPMFHGFWTSNFNFYWSLAL